jgi:MoaA/NifB/PqqE/SkfB family radical SAM enzyme
MNLIIETFGEETLELSAMNGVSFASLDGELLRLMKRAGFKTINLSLVSTDTSTKERMRRPEAVIGFDKILEEVERVGLHVIAYVILGMPDQTIDEMVNTIIYLMGKQVLIGPSIYYPTPGTPLFEKCKENGFLPSQPSQWRSSALPIETKDFDHIDIVTLFRLLRVINFIKGKMGEGELSEGTTLKELLQVLEEKKKITPYAPWGRRYALCDRDDTITWIDLLLHLFRERSFFSLRRDPGRGPFIAKEKSSKKVLDYFFENAWGKPILKSKA